MAIQMFEIFGSREVSRDKNGRRSTWLYMLTGSNDSALLEETLIARTPNRRGDGQVRQRTNVEQVEPYYWRGTVEYQHPEKKENPEGELSFDISTEKTKITHSLDTRSYAAEGEEAPDFKGAIGVTGDGKDQRVDGVEVPIPSLSFTLTVPIPQKKITLAYISTLYKLAGKTNKSPWKEFGEQEVIFMGARGSVKGDDPYNVAFVFVASETVEGLKIGDIAGIKKRGHEYLWVRYEPRDDDEGGFVVPTPQAVYVEKVIETADFSELELGD